jgi:hypothetical protein
LSIFLLNSFSLLKDIINLYFPNSLNVSFLNTFAYFLTALLRRFTSIPISQIDITEASSKASSREATLNSRKLIESMSEKGESFA